MLEGVGAAGLVKEPPLARPPVFPVLERLELVVDVAEDAGLGAVVLRGVERLGLVEEDDFGVELRLLLLELERDGELLKEPPPPRAPLLLAEA